MSAPRDPFAAGPVVNTDPSAGGSFPGSAPKLPPDPPVWTPVPPPLPPQRRRPLGWFVVAAIVLVTGLAVVLALLFTGQLGSGIGPFSHQAKAPSDDAPPLAKACPAPSVAPTGGPDDGPAPTGPRTVDAKAGISYQAYGAPWITWPASFNWNLGTLAVPYDAGQYFVTEHMPTGDDYLASILSGAVPAAVNDSTDIDIECTGKQVAADVRVSYYPQPTTMDVMRAGLTMLGGRPAWVTEFRLHFHEDGLQATDELVGVATIDVGRPTAAVLYVSIPGTHRQWDYVVDQVLNSVRPA
jgi:hypothetical protein